MKEDQKKEMVEVIKLVSEKIQEGTFNFSGTYDVSNYNLIERQLAKNPPPPPPVTKQSRTERWSWWIQCPTSWHMPGQLRNLCYKVGILHPQINETVSGWIFKSSYITLLVDDDVNKVDWLKENIDLNFKEYY